MNCWKTKYGYGGTDITLCNTYYVSVGDSPYTFSECYRDDQGNCRRPVHLPLPLPQILTLILTLALTAHLSPFTLTQVGDGGRLRQA